MFSNNADNYEQPNGANTMMSNQSSLNDGVTQEELTDADIFLSPPCYDIEKDKTKLNLEGCDFNDKSIDTIISLLMLKENKHITHLDLSRNALGVDGVKKLLKVPHLKHIDFSLNRLRANNIPKLNSSNKNNINLVFNPLNIVELKKDKQNLIQLKEDKKKEESTIQGSTAFAKPIRKLLSETKLAPHLFGPNLLYKDASNNSNKVQANLPERPTRKPTR